MKRQALALLAGLMTAGVAHSSELVRDTVHMWSQKGGYSSVCKTLTRYVGAGFSTAVPILNGQNLEYRKEDSWGQVNWYGTAHDDHVQVIQMSVTRTNEWPEWGYVQYRVCAEIDDATVGIFAPPITYFRGDVDILVLD